MKGTVLEQIVNDKRISLVARKKQEPLLSFADNLPLSDRDFYQALRSAETAFILECKKASPSKGLIRQDFNLSEIAAAYAPYATAVSVLTDEKYFQGQHDYLRQVRALITQPVLCKDFIIDAYQVYLARHYGADAILLMLSVLNDADYHSLATLAHSLNMGVLTEVSTEEELHRAIALDAQVIGINNRDLRDLSIDRRRTADFAPHIPADRIIISESGITTHQHIRELRPHADGFLIGSAIMAQPDLDTAIRSLIYGEHKVCGLTRADDARAAYDAGATFGGLIFVSKSPRYVDEAQAAEVMRGAPLAYVGVFRNHDPADIAAIARRLKLHAVQLHGDENEHDIALLRLHLPAKCEIWKALDMSHGADITVPDGVVRLVLDNGKGGTGQTFDWQTLPPSLPVPFTLAGGLNAENCVSAAASGAAGLDFNSGAESAPGIKDAEKLRQIFNQLHQQVA